MIAKPANLILEDAGHLQISINGQTVTLLVRTAVIHHLKFTTQPWRGPGQKEALRSNYRALSGL